jgi:formyl-CoA transferase
LACGNDNLFKKFCVAADCASVAEEARFLKNSDRVKNRTEFEPILAAVIAKKTTKVWSEILEGAGVAVGPINAVTQAFEGEQTKARNTLLSFPHPLAGPAPAIVAPMKFSLTPVEYKNSAPLLGQHKDEILAKIKK